MTEREYLAILSRLSAHAPSDLDGDLFPPLEVTPGALLDVGKATTHAISAKLWQRFDDATSYIGIRETAPLEDYAQVTARLLSAALERRVAPIILTTLGRSGFTRFGLRVERLAGDTDAARAVCEAQLKSLWDLAIIIDAQQVASLG